jgi:hypothetical protein
VFTGSRVISEHREGEGWISLLTGFPDDRREPLSPEHSLYPIARRLLDDQDNFTVGEHRVAFDLACSVWPTRRGPRSLVETQITWSGMLLARGLSRDDIAYVLGVRRQTLTKRRILQRGESWRAEVLGSPPVTFSERFPRVIPGYYLCTLLELGDDQGRYPHLPSPPGDPPNRAAEAEYLRRFAEVRSRTQAA